MKVLLIILTVFLCASCLRSQNFVCFNPDSNFIFDARHKSIGDISNETVSEIIFAYEDQKRRLAGIMIEKRHGQFEMMTVTSPQIYFDFGNGCLIYCGLRRIDIESIFNQEEINYFANPDRYYVGVGHYENDLFVNHDGEYFVLYLMDDAVNRIVYSVQIDTEEY